MKDKAKKPLVPNSPSRAKENKRNGTIHKSSPARSTTKPNEWRPPEQVIPPPKGSKRRDT